MNRSNRPITRRAHLAGLAAATLGAGMAALPHLAQAQTWPARPVRLVVPTAAGTAPDVIARLVAERLNTAWGQAVVVDNRPGAGGIPGMSAIARAPADGYTVGFVPAAAIGITPHVYKNPQFNPDTDMKPVATVGTGPMILVTSATSGITDLRGLAEYSRANPGKSNLAAPQMNSLPHLAVELVNKQGDMKLTTVPYPNAPAAVTAVIAGDAVITADGAPGVLPHIKSGRLRALAVTSRQRLAGLDIPTVAETFPGFEVVGWFVLYVPTGTPAAVGERINAEVMKITQSPDFVARVQELGVFAVQHNLAASQEFSAAQQRLLKNLVTELGISPQ